MSKKWKDFDIFFVGCWKEERPSDLERVPSVIHSCTHVTMLVATWYWRYTNPEIVLGKLHQTTKGTIKGKTVFRCVDRTRWKFGRSQSSQNINISHPLALQLFRNTNTMEKVVSGRIFLTNQLSD